MSKRIHLRPIGKIHAGAKIGRPLRKPHDEADHVAINERVLRVIDFAGEYAKLRRHPTRLAAESLNVRIALWRVFARFSGNDVDREECVRLPFEGTSMNLHKLENFFAVASVANTCADNDLVKSGRIDICALADLGQCDGVSGAFQHVPQPTADPQRVTVNGRVSNEDLRHVLEA